MNEYQAAMYIGSEGTFVCKTGYKLPVYIIDVQTRNNQVEALISSKELQGTAWKPFNKIVFKQGE